MYALRAPQFKDLRNGTEAEYAPRYLWYKLTNIAQRPLQPELWPFLHTVQARNAWRSLADYCNVTSHTDMEGAQSKGALQHEAGEGEYVAREPI